MNKYLIAALLVGAVVLSNPAVAQTIADKDSCALGIADVEKMRASSDAGAKANQQADDLIEVATHLCGQANFVYAEKVLGAIRALLSTE